MVLFCELCKIVNCVIGIVKSFRSVLDHRTRDTKKRAPKSPKKLIK